MAELIKITSNFTSADWLKLDEQLNGTDEEEAWERAVGVLHDRLRERYLSPIECLIQAFQDGSGPKGITPGFAILGLCCPVIETMASFRRTERGATGKELFTSFLRRVFQFDDTTAAAFYSGIRNGILHDAETRKWVIRAATPRGRIVIRDGGRYYLNRSEFYRTLAKEFRDYIEEVRDPANVDLRTRFRKKMNDLVREA